MTLYLVKRADRLNGEISNLLVWVFKLELVKYAHRRKFLDDYEQPLPRGGDTQQHVASGVPFAEDCFSNHLNSEYVLNSHFYLAIAVTFEVGIIEVFTMKPASDR